MSLRTLATTSCLLWMTCAPEIRPRLYEGHLPAEVHVDLAGTFTLSPAGEISLALAEPCRILVTQTREFVTTWKRCSHALLDMIHVVAATPWGGQLPGVWLDEAHIVFHVDWKHAGLDRTDADLPALVGQPWKIPGTTWTPNAGEVDRILSLLGAATETNLVSGGLRPDLQVTRFDIGDGTLHAGGESTLTLQITNRGPGTAYRVAATVRSGIMSLHGRRAAFGMIRPGAAKLRRLRLTIPASEIAPDTMLLLVFNEGNGFSPPGVSRRVPIAAPSVAPVLGIQCSIPGRALDQPGIDAGEQLVVHCVIDNSGTGAANVVLETSLAGATPVVSPAKRIAPGERASLDAPIAIPRDLEIDAAVEIAIAAVDLQSAREARTRIVGVIHKPRLCAAGQLTHTQYNAKLAALRAALAAGDLTQDQFDRYDLELVTCLNDAR
jgi:hypothetical protein